MWGKPPFFIADNCAIDVQNLAAAREWYKEKLDCAKPTIGRKTIPAGRLSTCRSLLTIHVFRSSRHNQLLNRHIFLATNLEKAHACLTGRGIAVEPLSVDSGGNRLFRFQDLEGNAIEVCVEPH